MSYSEIKKGKYLVFRNEFPCKVVEVNTSAPGRHGAARKRCVGIDVITNKKYIDIFRHSSRVVFPKITKFAYSLVDIGDSGYLIISDSTETVREDLKLKDKDLIEKLERENPDNYENYVVTVLVAEFDGETVEGIYDVKTK